MGVNMGAKTMNAVVVQAPGEYGVERVPVPDCPEAGLLLKVHACGLCGSDLRTLRRGHHRVTLPWIIGHEVSGTVAAVGARYQGRWQLGAPLSVAPLAFCGRCDPCIEGRHELCHDYRELAQAWPGGLAEYMAIPEPCVRLGTIQTVPDGLDMDVAGIAEPISSCINAQEKGRIGLGDTVLVIGTGPIGCIHISLARSRGADKVFVADLQAARLAMAGAFEPDALIDASKTDLVEEARRLTNGKGPDVVISANPSPKSQVAAVEMAAKGGRVLLFGGLPPEESRPGIDMNLVHYNALHVIGTTIFAPRHQLMALRLMASGRIPMDRLVTHRFPLAEFRRGAGMALEGRVLKAVFTVS
ncbi:MAG: alcohol dehydrogenase catalytic domain-containing protein [Kiritimatiellae bacterium]|nr:alcohol dehydrogenase catalytic domain-containing protein [Kiritimatiellia bacterium]